MQLIYPKLPRMHIRICKSIDDAQADFLSSHRPLKYAPYGDNYCRALASTVLPSPLLSKSVIPCR